MSPTMTRDRCARTATRRCRASTPSWPSTTGSVVIAAELTTDSPDFGHLEPMVRAAQRELRAVELGDPGVVVADAGYWHQRQIETVVADGIQVLVAPDSSLRRGARPGSTGGLYDFMRGVLATPAGRALYRQRQATIAPVFGQLKFNRAIRRFQRRGRAACRSEWRLIAATHNLLGMKLRGEGSGVGVRARS
jgi:Transposase DDE domain